MDSTIDGSPGNAVPDTKPGLTPRPLWKQPDFLRFWTSEAAAQLAIQLSTLLLPLIAATTLNATPFEVGLLAALEWTPFLVIGLVAGVWVDRMRRRPVMIAANLARAVLMTVPPIMALSGQLTIESLYVVAVLAGVCTVFFDIAYVSILPALVTREELVDGNSKLQGTASGAQIAGPGLGGLLARALGAPIALVANGAMFLIAGLLLLRVNVVESAAERQEHSSFGKEIREGITTVLHSPILRTLALASGTVSFAGAGLFLSIYLLFMSRNLGLDAGAIGLVFATGGLGALAGSLVAGPLHRRFGQGPLILYSMFAFGATGTLVPLAVLAPSVALPLVVASEFLQWMAIVIYDINAFSLRQAIVPDRLSGRVTGAMRFFASGLRPVGALLGGILGGTIGLAQTLVLGEIIMLFAFLWLLFSPIRKVRDPESLRGLALVTGATARPVASRHTSNSEPWEKIAGDPPV